MFLISEIKTLKSFEFLVIHDKILFHSNTMFLGDFDSFRMGMVTRIIADGDCSHEIKRCLLLGRKVMTNLDRILISKDITLPTKFCLVKAIVFPVVMYGVRVEL